MRTDGEVRLRRGRRKREFTAEARGHGGKNGEDTGRDEGAAMVLQTADKHGWFWCIPLHDDIVSVGVVAPFDYLFKHRKGSHKVWAPMEALYAPGKQAIPSWQEGLVPDQVPEKANQLILPESPRPHDTHGH